MPRDIKKIASDFVDHIMQDPALRLQTAEALKAKDALPELGKIASEKLSLVPPLNAHEIVELETEMHHLYDGHVKRRNLSNAMSVTYYIGKGRPSD